MRNLRKETGLRGARVLVTGATSGLGRAFAVELISRGATVIMVGRRRSRLRELAKRAKARSPESIGIGADLSCVEEIRRASRVIKSKLGGIDVLVNNAGLFIEPAETWRLESRNWNVVINTNLRAAVLLARSFLGGMLAQRKGCIANIVSGTSDCYGVLPYRTSKVGLEVLTRGLAEELASTGVGVFGFNPGWMKTEISDFGNSPTFAARALANLLDGGDWAYRGEIFDHEVRARRSRVTKRHRGRGRFGC